MSEVNKSKKKKSIPILFITRTFPPVSGGMEMLSYNLTSTLSKLTSTTIIKNPYGKKALPFFIPWAFFKAIIILLFKEIKVVHLSDGVLAPIGYALKILFPKIKFAITIHGLDLTYVETFPAYYYTNIIFIKKLDLIIAVSSETKIKCLEHGIEEKKIKVILNGTHLNQYYDPKLKNGDNKKWNKILSGLSSKTVSYSQKFKILYLGRLAIHKGVPWFVKNIMPELPADFILLIAGMGPEFNKIKKIIQNSQLENKVFLLGAVSEEIKKYLLNASDILVMPNVKVPGSREGFGITAIEAGSCELVPVVSKIQGLKDAIKHKENGLHIKPQSKTEFLETIKFLKDNPEYRMKLARKSRQYIKENYDWPIIGKKYLEEFEKLSNEQ